MNTKLTTILKIVVAIATALLGTLGVTQAMN
ncbi:MAG: smalltalk protein [Prevotella sp.]|nr:smalltalk protein [Prevotella sp.]